MLEVYLIINNNSQIFELIGHTNNMKDSFSWDVVFWEVLLININLVFTVLIFKRFEYYLLIYSHVLLTHFERLTTKK